MQQLALAGRTRPGASGAVRIWPASRPVSIRAVFVFLAVSFLPWIALHLLLVLSFHYSMKEVPYWQMFVNTVGNALGYWLLTPGMILLGFRASEAGRGKAALIYALGAVAFCLLHPVLRVLTHRTIGLFLTLPLVPFSLAAFHNLWTNFTLYLVMVCGATALAHHTEARERAVRQIALRAELAESRLRLLKAQIHPHFLFNTLHDISGLMATDVKAARAMIGRLEELLHIAVSEQSEELVPLHRDMKFLECYLDLEKMRLGERLTVTLDLDPETLPALVPSMVLQPVVENSIKHGIAKFSHRGWLRIASRREGDTLRLTVEDSGPGISGSAKPGVGLSNTEARLNFYYSRQQSIEYMNLTPEGFRCEIAIPFSAAQEPVGVQEYTL